MNVKMDKKSIQLIKLALKKMAAAFADIKTDKGVLIYDGELALDVEVQIEDADGNVVTAPDDEYTLEDGRIVVVKDGKVAEIKDAPVEEETVEEVLEEIEPVKDEKDLKIEELEGLLKDKDAVIEDLTAKIKELEAKLNEPAEDAVEMSAVVKDETNKFSNYSKYFN